MSTGRLGNGACGANGQTLRFGAFATLLTPPLMPYSQYKVGRLGVTG